MPEPERARAAMRFVLLMAVVGLLGSAVHHAARSTVGPYLAQLGASATMVGTIAGIGGAVGFGLRILIGRSRDPAGIYWRVTIAGYALGIVAVPLLAMVGSWQAVALLFVLERLGTALHRPATATLHRSTAHDRAGRSFLRIQICKGLGGLLGPALIATMLALWSSERGPDAYRRAFLLIGIPGLMALVALLGARLSSPVVRVIPYKMPTVAPAPPGSGRYDRSFVIYMIGIALVGFGLADWALLAFHVERRAVVDDAAIPLIYLGACIVRWFSWVRLSLPPGFAFGSGAARRVLAATLVAASASLPLVLLGGAGGMVLGIVLWAVALAAVDSLGGWIVRALSPPSRVGAAYVVFYTVLGGSWLVGSIALGILSDWSRPAAATCGAVALIAAGLVILAADHAVRSRRTR
jgi:hypothetical protein